MATRVRRRNRRGRGVRLETNAPATPYSAADEQLNPGLDPLNPLDPEQHPIGDLLSVYAPPPLRPKGVGGEDPDELFAHAKAEMDRWEPLHRRMVEDLEAFRGHWFETETSPNELLGSADLISDVTLRTQTNKAIAMLSTADPVVGMDPNQPEQTQLVQSAEDGWRYFEDQVESKHARAGHGAFRYEEAHYACIRGWIARRIRLLPDKLMANEFPFEVQLVDMASVSPVYGTTHYGCPGLKYVIQRQKMRRLDILAQWPELEDQGIKELEPPKHKEADYTEELDVITVCSEWDYFYYVQEKHVKTIPHDYGFVPWVIHPCRSIVLPFGMSSVDTVSSFSVGNSVMQGTVLGEADTADMGVSFFNELIGPVRNLVRHMSLLSRRAEDDVLGRWKVKSNSDPTAIDITGAQEPGGKVNLNAANGDDVEPLQLPANFQYIEVMLQRWQQQVEQGGLPSALWGLNAEATSALHQTYITSAATDALNPYLLGQCSAREQTWYLAMCLMARFAPDWAPLRFLVRHGAQAFWAQLTPDDFTALKESRLRANYRNLLPQERTANITNALALARAGLGDKLTLLGDDFVGLDDPALVLRRMAAESGDEFPPIKMFKAIRAIKEQDPELFAMFGPLLLQQLQQATQAVQQPPASQPPQPPQPGQAPGVPSPPGAVLPLPVPGGVGGAGAPPPGAPLAASGPPSPAGPMPYNEPGMPAMMAGLPAVPGGLDMGGVPTSMGGSPYGYGQSVAGPGAEPPAIALMRMLMAQHNSGAMPTR